jgi:hypothetical protein
MPKRPATKPGLPYRLPIPPNIDVSEDTAEKIADAAMDFTNPPSFHCLPQIRQLFAAGDYSNHLKQGVITDFVIAYVNYRVYGDVDPQTYGGALEEAEKKFQAVHADKGAEWAMKAVIKKVDRLFDEQFPAQAIPKMRR